MYKFSINRDTKKALLFFAIILLTMLSVVIMSELYKSKAYDENSRIDRRNAQLERQD